MNTMRNFILVVMVFLCMVLPEVSFGNYEVIEETYVVESGDTFWDICETYLEKNTYDRVYIRTFMEDVRRDNNLDASCQLRPGQVLKIRYKINKDI